MPFTARLVSETQSCAAWAASAAIGPMAALGPTDGFSATAQGSTQAGAQASSHAGAQASVSPAKFGLQGAYLVSTGATQTAIFCAAMAHIP